jgi:hypothetical protein
MFDTSDGLYGITKAVVATVSEWIVTLRAQRRMKKSLGRKPRHLLTRKDLQINLSAWMAAK